MEKGSTQVLLTTCVIILNKMFPCISKISEKIQCIDRILVIQTVIKTKYTFKPILTKKSHKSQTC